MNDTAKIIFGIVGGFFVLFLLLILAGGSIFGMGGGMMGGFGNAPGQMMGGFGSWWVLVPVLFWAGLLALIGWAIARIFPKGRSGSEEHRRDNAEEVLRERFARGEVDAEEYERSLQLLRGSTQRNKESNLN